ncbi:AAA family ATPase [Sinorhizobium numidicum]|uniref:AAA family ATPase n=1 Tax=Sinorhizobium numidicum TaxID=680248 RepID=A0ABY8CY01_9HYPH|nr:AAA family ATPase [Sinorhizobium numidicum]WEX76865.1 AAA family ATPase [Sinorhizobium numidicum]WEX83525.1 AAA family ATPase [Sinorhizobium numidicum]
MTFKFSVPYQDGQKEFAVEPGNAIIFVGANGGGKTRLAVQIETNLGLDAHRISAHRALNLNPDVAKIGEKKARMGLRTGNASENADLRHRAPNRWGGQKGAVRLLDDFDFLLQVLFAEQANTSLKAYNQHKPGAGQTKEEFQLTKFDLLSDIWSRLLPHRVLHISGDDILVSLPTSDLKYNASEMSDGERAIFYMIGQTLVAEPNQVLIIDEPELHVHRSIMSKLWDELEAARPDCAFIFITHDLEFAAARAARKYVIRDYEPTPRWTIDEVPADTGFDEDLATLILGSRRPILFVEGGRSSLDLPLYRCCYPEWTVVPRSSCTEVIHAVVTMRANEELTRITCCGIVDADDYSDEDKKYLSELGIETLPVSEIENLVLLPTISRAIAEADGYRDAELEKRLGELAENIFQSIDSDEKIEAVAVRYAKRRIDRMLKKVDLSKAKTIEQLEDELTERIGELNIRTLAERLKHQIHEAIRNRDLPGLLAHYDNKGLMNLAATKLKSTRLTDFESWLTRTLRNKTAPNVVNAISNYLPKIIPS